MFQLSPMSKSTCKYSKNTALIIWTTVFNLEMNAPLTGKAMVVSKALFSNALKQWSRIYIVIPSRSACKELNIDAQFTISAYSFRIASVNWALIANSALPVWPPQLSYMHTPAILTTACKLYCSYLNSLGKPREKMQLMQIIF